VNVAMLVVNYNLSGVVDELVKMESDVEHRWIVVDNGSDIPSVNTTIFIRGNTGGMMPALLAGLRVVTEPFIWILTTSMTAILSEGDPIKLLLDCFDENTVGVSPLWAGELTGPHRMNAEWGERPYLNTASCWRTEWLKDNLPDKRLVSGWGTDFEISYFARQQGKTLRVCKDVSVTIKEHNGYPEKRPMKLKEFNDTARDTMNAVLSEKYGSSWRDTLCSF
jgi:hypothetical protein